MRQRYHATGTCEFDPESIKRTIDKVLALMVEHLGHEVRLFNVVTTTHPAGGNAMLITVIAEDFGEDQ